MLRSDPEQDRSRFGCHRTDAPIAMSSRQGRIWCSCPVARLSWQFRDETQRICRARSDLVPALLWPLLPPYRYFRTSGVMTYPVSDYRADERDADDKVDRSLDGASSG